MPWSAWTERQLLTIATNPTRSATVEGIIHADSEHWGAGAPAGSPLPLQPYGDRLDAFDFDGTQRTHGSIAADYGFSNDIGNVTPYDGALGEYVNEITGNRGEGLVEFDGTALIDYYCHGHAWQDASDIQYESTDATFLGWGSATFAGFADPGTFHPSVTWNLGAYGGSSPEGAAQPRLALLDNSTGAYETQLVGDEYAAVPWVPFDSGTELAVVGAAAGGPWPTLTVDLRPLAGQTKVLLLAQLSPPGWGSPGWVLPGGNVEFNNGVGYRLDTQQLTLVFRPPRYRTWNDTGVEPYLRMGQRNDGLGPFRHPRLASSRTTPNSVQAGQAPRVGRTNRYR